MIPQHPAIPLTRAPKPQHILPKRMHALDAIVDVPVIKQPLAMAAAIPQHDAAQLPVLVRQAAVGEPDHVHRRGPVQALAEDAARVAVELAERGGPEAGDEVLGREGVELHAEADGVAGAVGRVAGVVVGARVHEVQHCEDECGLVVDELYDACASLLVWELLADLAGES